MSKFGPIESEKAKLLHKVKVKEVRSVIVKSQNVSPCNKSQKQRKGQNFL